MKSAGARAAVGELRGVLALAATYVYFLLFAQYGFLHLYSSRVAGAAFPPVMAAMGLAGLGASIAAAAALGTRFGARLVPAAFLAAGIAALLALRVEGVAGFAAVAAAIGAAVGALTVGLASDLDRWLTGPAKGLAVGLATGSAYVVANVPAFFSGTPELAVGVAVLAAAVGWLACRGAASRSGGPAAARPPAPRSLIARADCAPRGVAAVAVIFVALVGLDSAAFAIIQDTLALKSPTWGTGAQSLRMGALHLAGALAGGILVDRGRFFPLVGGVGIAFTGGLLLLDAGTGAAAIAGALYALGIGAYSTALVLYPSARGDEPGLVTRRWRAAAVFGAGGWLGSALGVGASQRFDRIPIGLIAAAGGLLLMGFLLRRVEAAPRMARTWGVTFAIGAAAWWAHPGPAAQARTAGAIERGRAVYVSEGCLHCHSQYVRAEGIDSEWWGPWSAVQEAGDPPLYGVRRQGPDLRNVGNRRSPAWHRLHLIDPRSVSPGSRMPAYPHLFSPDSHRGEDLIVYLASLGAATASERWHEVQALPVHAADQGSPERGRSLFAVWCSQCHGREGRGDGPQGAELATRERLDLTQGPLALVSFGPGIGTREEGLAHLVRFGAPGTSMPGHEHLAESEIADLVAAVEAMNDTTEAP